MQGLRPGGQEAGAGGPDHLEERGPSLGPAARSTLRHCILKHTPPGPVTGEDADAPRGDLPGPIAHRWQSWALPKQGRPKVHLCCMEQP